MTRDSSLVTRHSASAASDAEYLLGPEDQVTVAVLGAAEYPEFAQPWVVVVRPDGKVTLPRLGEMTVAGKTAAQVKAAVEEGLRRFFKQPPAVNVAITGFRQPGLVYVLGEVERQNAFPYREGIGAMEALALAGGPTPAADLTAVTVTRGADRRSVRVDLSRVTRQDAPEQNIGLQPGDVLLVPRRQRRSVVIVGGVNKPGPFEIAEEITILEALKLAEGPRERADLRGAVITRRDGSTVPVDLERLAREGDPALGHLKLGDGDTLVIPERLIRVYVAGEVAKPEALVLREGASLVEAVTECGWFTKEADLRKVRLARRAPDGQYTAETLNMGSLKDRKQPVTSVALKDGDFILVLPRGKKKKLEDYIPFVYPLDVLRRIILP